jgi:hypothetical protein
VLVSVYDFRLITMVIRIEFSLTATVEEVRHYSGREPPRMILVIAGAEY